MHIAVLHQGQPVPEIDGIVKPMKPGGYLDSSADIACALQSRDYDVIRPLPLPESPGSEAAWSFPDNPMGIRSALTAGADVLWANTALYRGHPLALDYGRSFLVVGQPLALVERWDNKLTASAELRRIGLPATSAHAVQSPAHASRLVSLGVVRPPVVVKPIRGRGSEGVALAPDLDTLCKIVDVALTPAITADGVRRRRFGNSMLIEEYLPGREMTLTVMPPGDYRIYAEHRRIDKHWALPAVERLHHQDGLAPYSGTVAVVRNSRVPADDDEHQPALQELARACESAAAHIGATAPIRIDCRQDSHDAYQLFDVNLKPNMTGPCRPGRSDQDSLTSLAARAIGWDYPDLIEGMLLNAVANTALSAAP
jgi:D-alanine-D-alanine ligase